VTDPTEADPDTAIESGAASSFREHGAAEESATAALADDGSIAEHHPDGSTTAATTATSSDSPDVPITLYWRPGCRYCMVLRRGLRRAGSTVVQVNIWDDPTGAAVVRGITGGSETVPTLVVGDKALVNPSSRTAVEVIRTYAPELIGSASAGPWGRLRRRGTN
jgi:glutaredoxin